jgi:hypothetical protein
LTCKISQKYKNAKKTAELHYALNAQGYQAGNRRTCKVLKIT